MRHRLPAPADGELRPPWRQDADSEWTRLPIARLRYTQATRTWMLHWRDQNLTPRL